MALNTKRFITAQRSWQIPLPGKRSSGRICQCWQPFGGSRLSEKRMAYNRCEIGNTLRPFLNAALFSRFQHHHKSFAAMMTGAPNVRVRDDIT